MKIKDYRILLVFLLFVTAFIGCDEKEVIEPEVKQIDPHEISIVNINPNTEEEYTLEELGQLLYDPGSEDYYDSTQVIKMYLHIPHDATKIEALRSNGVVFNSVTNIEKVESGYRAYFEFTVLDLGVQIFDETHLTFVVTYKDATITGDGLAVYKIHHIEKYIPPQYGTPFHFIKQSGDTVKIAIEVDPDLMSDGRMFGTVITHSNGSYAKVDAGSQLDFRHENDFTVGVWVNTDVNQSDPVIIGDKDWGSGGNPGFLFTQIGSNWKLNAGDGSNRIDVTGTDIDDGFWHFLAVSFDRDGEATVYTDGIKNSSSDMSALGNMSADLDLNLGQDGTGGYQPWDGKTGSAYIYDYVLTPEEILQIGASGASLMRSDGSISPLPTINEASSKTLDGNKVVYETNGSDELVTLDTIPELEFRFEEDFSVAVWVNTTVSQSDPVIAGDKNWGSGSNPGWLLTQIGSNWKLNMAGVASDTRIDITGNDINDGSWHLIGATFDRDGEVTIYQDGVAIESKDMSHVGTMQTPENYPIRLAQDGTGTYGYWYEGKVANCVITDYVLTAEEMMDLFNQ